MTMTSTALNAVGPTDALGSAIEGRASIFEMTQAAEDAVLRPKDVGAWSHALRAGMAARIANLNADPDLAKAYAADAGEFAVLADPSETGAEQGLEIVLAFMDKVAAETRTVSAEDISGLQAAGVNDADIVRLCELNAFLAYQLRVVAGLRLMKGAFA